MVSINYGLQQLITRCDTSSSSYSTAVTQRYSPAVIQRYSAPVYNQRYPASVNIQRYTVTIMYNYSSRICDGSSII